MSSQYKGKERKLNDLNDYYRVVQKQAPLGVSIVVKGNTIFLQFKTNHKTRGYHTTTEKFTIQGLNNALNKAILVKDKLTTYTSETEFWSWYDQEIKGINTTAKNDLVTIGQAIDKLNKDFFSHKDKRGLKRDINNKSDQASYHRQYGHYLSKLNRDTLLSVNHLLEL